MDKISLSLRDTWSITSLLSQYRNAMTAGLGTLGINFACQTVSFDNSGSLPILIHMTRRVISIDVLRSTRHLSVALHQGTEAAPTLFSAYTPYHASILSVPSCYPLCNVPIITQTLSLFILPITSIICVLPLCTHLTWETHSFW
jgi:hypothetical protein